MGEFAEVEENLFTNARDDERNDKKKSGIFRKILLMFLLKKPSIGQAEA